MLDAVTWFSLGRNRCGVRSSISAAIRRRLRFSAPEFRWRSFPFATALPTKGEWQLVQAGRLIEKKGLPVTIRAFEVFVRRYPNTTLRVAGEGPLLPGIRDVGARIKDSPTRVIHRVSFPRRNYARSITARTFSCTPARLVATEIKGPPNSMLEAMATGLPVFATEHGGIPEAIEHGVSGVLVPERLTNSYWWKPC